jgi:2-oxoglutarate dehydrogenase E1 component
MAEQLAGPGWLRFSGWNLRYLQDLYEQYEDDPQSVGEEWRQFFKEWQPPAPPEREIGEEGFGLRAGRGYGADALKTAVAASLLVTYIRNYGHLAAEFYPLPKGEREDTRMMDPASYQLTREDLESIPAGIVWEHAPGDVHSAWDAIRRLTEIYTQSTAYQFTHINNREEREWLTRKVESGEAFGSFSSGERAALLYRLLEVEEFEHFLHHTFLGQKRFSIEGVDMLVPMLDEIVRFGIENGHEHILIGMAHRGRLNVLAHVLGKPYEAIFSEFHHAPNKNMVPSEGSMGINYGWTGDVKYHLGANRSVPDDNRKREIRLTLANNPSHLEFVNPVVIGFARAAQDDRSLVGPAEPSGNKALSVLIHGDAAFPGEGVVEETLNLGKLPAYQVGGTIHIVANNRIGFTTESRDGRSTKYASDLVKGFEIPIVHVNADDPEACLNAVLLACEYRRLFGKDFLIDLVGYRRYGHNESDDPMPTQPQIYRQIAKHPAVASLYATKCMAEGVLDSGKLESWRREIQIRLQEAHNRVKAGESAENRMQASVTAGAASLDQAATAVSLERLRGIAQSLLTFPEGFHLYPKLEKILQRRAQMLDPGGAVDWAFAETLAFATILQEGRPIRMTGQDTQRGTFAHRHLVLRDVETGEIFSPLHRVPGAKASFSIYNSPLSETSVLGFEYGYSVFSPETLVLWEAQFGDFVNVAQVILDQFLASGRAKWGQRSGLVLLLPHGYEGQGPEHSSARLERFLQSSAEDNWTVCNVTSSAQYFHLLRRQSFALGTEHARPLVLMSPKSLLRHTRAASPGEAFAGGTFTKVMEPADARDSAAVSRLILSTGKIGVELLEKWEKLPAETQRRMHLARVEQLYPFPEGEIRELLGRFPRLREICWVQEEPKNMGAWTYMEPRLRELAAARTIRYIGRPERSSPAEGIPDAHRAEQERILTLSFTE